MNSESKFWAKVDKCGQVPEHVPELGSCWVWMGVKNRAGYGTLSFDGAPMLAHRVSWGLVNSKIPPGVFALHRCDNRACVRPSHLFLGTHADNAADRKSKGRCGDHRGTNNGCAVLSEPVVALIKARICDGVPKRQLATEFGMSRQTMSAIAVGEHWSHVPWPDGACFLVDSPSGRAARWKKRATRPQLQTKPELP